MLVYWSLLSIYIYVGNKVTFCVIAIFHTDFDSSKSGYRCWLLFDAVEGLEITEDTVTAFPWILATVAVAVATATATIGAEIGAEKESAVAKRFSASSCWGGGGNRLGALMVENSWIPFV